VQVAPAEQYMPQPESGNGLALNYEMQVAVRDRAVLIPISHYQHVLQKGDDAAKEVELKKVIDQMQIVSNDNADLNGIFIQYIDHLYKRELPLKNYTQDELIAVLHYALSNEHLTQETIDAKRVAAALSEFGALGEGTVNKFVANDAKLRRHIMNGYCAWLRLTLLKHVTNDPKASHLDAFGHVDKERTNAILEWCKKTVTPPVTRTSEIQWDIADIKSVEQTGSKGTESKQEGDEEDIDQFLA
jgi:hypothetical protein